MNVRITSDTGYIVRAEVDGVPYRIDMEPGAPGWGVWRRDPASGPDVDAARKWHDTLQALDAALDSHYGKTA